MNDDCDNCTDPDCEGDCLVTETFTPSQITAMDFAIAGVEILEDIFDALANGVTSFRRLLVARRVMQIQTENFRDAVVRDIESLPEV